MDSVTCRSLIEYPHYMALSQEYLFSWFPPRSDTNIPAPIDKKARGIGSFAQELDELEGYHANRTTN